MRKNKQQIQERFTSRRQFLAGAAGTFLTLPPLLSLMPRSVAAQVVNQKKVRSVIYIGSVGIDPHQIVPSTDPTGMITHPGAIHTRYKQLNTFSGPFSRMIDSSFTSMYPDMNIFKGLSLTGSLYSGHNHTVLAGSHSGNRSPLYGKSIDVIMEQSTNVYKPNDIVRQKALRISGDNGIDFSFDRIGGNVVYSNGLTGDTAVFNQMLAGLTGGTATVPQQQKINSQLIVDQVYNDLKTLETSNKISSEDLQILNRYVASIQSLQQRVQTINNGTAQVCAPPSLTLETSASPRGPFPTDSRWGINSTGVMFDNYMEMIRIAFQCDLTRVVYIQNSIWSDLPIGPASNGGLHHTCPSSDIAADRQQWGLKKMLLLAQKLKATIDPHDSAGGTLLDNSTLLFTNELGAWTATHNTFSLPAVVFGKGGGAFRTGYYVDYSQMNRVNWGGIQYTPGRPFKQLLQGIMTSMGVPKTEYTQYGDSNGFGEFNEGVYQFGRSDATVFTPYRNEHNDTLPFINY